MKTFKLLFHQKSQQKQYAGEDIAVLSKDFPFLVENDIVEVYIPEENGPRILLKINKGSLRGEELSQKDAVSLDQSIGSIFQLKSFTDVIVNKVDPQVVELDSLELTFKDQYLGRSEMWRLKNSLVGNCVYVGKKLEFCSSTIRCQIHELWSGGNKVSSGPITQSTKIVFRSSTSMVYLFIQMSSEMWEFDIYGDLYFEKAVNGFLSELFAKWKKNGSNHEVTIVLFSRLYYNASSLDHFPEVMRECLLTDYKGRFYEDFYRVVIQNEKYEDWRNTLISLRHIFVDYHDYLLTFHKLKNRNARIPKATISSAAQGNFLEVLNMSLNVFEKHFIDRSFDRTGQLSVVITPGVGVFEVDRDLTNVTMQRVIDNGVGSDLVCVGEQPLHAVPLLKFHNKATHQNNIDDYSMPHWINLSFYSTNKRVGYANFIPRIKLPTRTITYSDPSPSSNNSSWRSSPSFSISAVRVGDETSWPNSVYDYDNYDENVFKPTSCQMISKKRIKQATRPKNLSEIDFSKMFLRQNSEPEMHQSTTSDFASLQNPSIMHNISSSMVLPPTQPSSAITIPSKLKFKNLENHYSSSFGALNIELKSKVNTTPNKEKWFTDDLVTNKTTQVLSPSNSSQGGSPNSKEKDLSGRSGELRRPTRSLINPFDPSHAVIKLTSNRRRWTHIFPRGPSGTLIQQHHFPGGIAKLDIVPEVEASISESVDKTDSGRQRQNRSLSKDTSEGNLGARMLTRLWGATGEQQWSPALTTGVDWKSLTIPACLPLTTDYFPDERSLQVDYLFSDYSLLPDDVNADYSSQRAVYRRPLTTKEVFLELVSQRLAQGFQTVIRPKNDKTLVKQHSTLIRLNSNIERESVEEYFLSIGRIFHRITLSASTITVTRYRPKHPYPSIKIDYKYRFFAPNNNNFEVSFADFSTEKLENYNWNYLDHHICTRGDRDFALTENLKYWRFRMLILPINQGVMKRLLVDGAQCNIYTQLSLEEKRPLIQEFLKFTETCINRIRRPNNSVPKGPRGPSGGSQSSTGSGGGFRERVNSNQLTERPRIRSGSKLADKQRQESGNGRISPFDSNFESKGSLVSITDPFIELSNPLPPPLRTDVTTEGPILQVKLKPDAAYQEIIAAMRSQKTGIPLIKSSDLPPWTFVSYDAVMWLVYHMEGVTNDFQAVEVLKGMLKERLILHASGDSNHKFVNGFYLYYIVSNDADGLHLMEPLHCDSIMFHNEWMEVEVPCQDIPKSSSSLAEPDICSNKKSKTSELYAEPTAFKDVYVDVDVSKKSDRQEWGHVRYQSVFKPDEAFEITAQWIQATGAIMTDLVQGWSRKAQQCNLQLVPVPTDPFALPNSSYSDPLRGPISIPLDTQTLIDNFANLEKGFSEEEWKENMLYFQHITALQFGFVRSPKHQHYQTAKQQDDFELHYVHSSGNMFIIIQANRSIIEAEYLWSWNYMVSKRWRTSSTPALGDDPFMFKVLHDFTAFCKNDDNRLVNSWSTLFIAPKENTQENLPEPAVTVP